MPFKVHSLLKQCWAETSVGTERGTSADFGKVPCFESAEDRANTVVKINGF